MAVKTMTQLRPSRLQKMWKGISIVFESRVATVGMAMVLFWVILALISLFWTPYDPNASDFIQNQGPSAQNWLGTDHLGRDIFSRLMQGTQVILLKTRLPEISLGTLLIYLASIPALVGLGFYLSFLARLFGTRVMQLGLLGLILDGILSLILYPFPESPGVWGNLGIILSGLLSLVPLIFFIVGWIRVALKSKLSSDVLYWTVSWAIVLILVLVSRPLQGYNAPDNIPGGVAIWGVAGSLAFGALLGLNAGYRGGWWDQSISQILDALIAFPRIVLYLVVIAALGQGDLVVILAITITGAPGVARLARSLALDIKTRDYIRAAETRGESVWYIMFREILPNARGPLLVDGMLRVGYAIFAIGTLGFLGIGLPPPDPDWGNMVNEARRNIFSNQLAVIWPALAIASLVIGLNLFADGLREELTRYQK